MDDDLKSITKALAIRVLANLPRELATRALQRSVYSARYTDGVNDCPIGAGLSNGDHPDPRLIDAVGYAALLSARLLDEYKRLSKIIGDCPFHEGLSLLSTQEIHEALRQSSGAR